MTLAWLTLADSVITNGLSSHRCIYKTNLEDIYYQQIVTLKTIVRIKIENCIRTTTRNYLVSVNF